MITKLFKEYNIPHTIVPAQKRTMVIKFKETCGNKGVIFRGLINFPKCIFYQNHRKYYELLVPQGYAVNENDELCHLPFFNVNRRGEICISNDRFTTHEMIARNFIVTPFVHCTDTYASAIHNYLLRCAEKHPIPKIQLHDVYNSQIVKTFYEHFDEFQLEKLNYNPLNSLTAK